MKFNPWTCSKCKKEFPRESLTELFGWAEYLCTPCIELFLQPERLKRSDDESRSDSTDLMGNYERPQK